MKDWPVFTPIDESDIYGARMDPRESFARDISLAVLKAVLECERADGRSRCMCMSEDCDAGKHFDDEEPCSNRAFVILRRRIAGVLFENRACAGCAAHALLDDAMFRQEWRPGHGRKDSLPEQESGG